MNAVQLDRLKTDYENHNEIVKDQIQRNNQVQMTVDTDLYAAAMSLYWTNNHFEALRFF